MPLRAKQILVLMVGVLVAVGMVWLGLWQTSRYQTSAEDVARDRASQPAVELLDYVETDGSIRDVYGRQVLVTGTWTNETVAVGTAMPLRVVQLLKTSDGLHIPVVLGQSSGNFKFSLPEGQHTISGILTSSDPVVEAPVPPGAPQDSLSSLRLQSLAQQWPSPLLPGYITINAEAAAEAGLEPAVAPLPQEQGSGMHQGYALQWWVFAGAVLVFAVVIARGMKQPRRRG